MLTVTRHYKQESVVEHRPADSVEIGVDAAHTIVVEEGDEEPREVRVIIRTAGADAECVWSIFL